MLFTCSPQTTRCTPLMLLTRGEMKLPIDLIYETDGEENERDKSFWNILWACMKLRKGGTESVVDKIKSPQQQQMSNAFYCISSVLISSFVCVL